MKKIERRTKNINFYIMFAILTILLIGITSCMPTRKMTKPNGCKPKKETKYKMIEPDFKQIQKQQTS